MSSVTASTLRLLERMLDKIRRGSAELGASPPKLLEYVLVRATTLGRRVENGVVTAAKHAAALLDALQRSLYESVPLSSMLIGVLFTVAVLAIAVATVMSSAR